MLGTPREGEILGTELPVAAYFHPTLAPSSQLSLEGPQRRAAESSSSSDEEWDPSHLVASTVRNLFLRPPQREREIDEEQLHYLSLLLIRHALSPVCYFQEYWKNIKACVLFCRMRVVRYLILLGDGWYLSN